VSPDGTTVFLTGSVGDAFGMSDYATVAYDAATGAELWERTYGRDGASPSWEGASAIAVSPDGGRVFVSGDSSQNTVTLAYDARTGSTMWRARLRIIDGQQVVDMAVSPDGGRVFVTGDTIRELAQWATSATVAYDARTGQEIWETGSASTETPTFVTSMAVSPDSGIVFIAGRRIGTGDYFVAVTTAFDAASGDMLWGRRYSGELGFSTTANSIVAGPDGSTVYVTGATGRPRNADYATLAYDAVSGAEVWIRRFQGSGDDYDQANAVAMDPAGTRVFVTGQSEGSTSLDYVTIAYSA
jgi:outer membrane protein assembly factor BamB